MNCSDWTGSIGVTMLLVAFLLMLLNKISKDGIAYLLMNLYWKRPCGNRRLAYTLHTVHNFRNRLDGCFTARNMEAL